MKPIALILLVPLTLFAADNGAKEDTKTLEKAKEREYNKDTGLPIYDEDEPKPVGVNYHIRWKTAEPAAPPESAKEPEKVEVKKLPTPTKEREYNKDTGYPVYDENETPPTGITYHLRNKTYTAATSGFT